MHPKWLPIDVPSNNRLVRRVIGRAGNLAKISILAPGVRGVYHNSPTPDPEKRKKEKRDNFGTDEHFLACRMSFPERLRTIHEMADLRNSRALEVGAGDGRLTFQYPRETKSVVGIDTKESAVRSCRVELRAKIQFLCARATALPLLEQKFEVVWL